MEPEGQRVLSTAFGREHGNAPLCCCGAYLPVASITHVESICQAVRSGSLPKPCQLQLTQGLQPLEQGYLRWLMLSGQPINAVDLSRMPRLRCRACRHRYLLLYEGRCLWCAFGQPAKW